MQQAVDAARPRLAVAPDARDGLALWVDCSRFVVLVLLLFCVECADVGLGLALTLFASQHSSATVAQLQTATIRTETRHYAQLQDPVTYLRVVHRIPRNIKKHEARRRHEVDADRAGARREQEDPGGALRVVERGDERGALARRRGAVEAQHLGGGAAAARPAELLLRWFGGGVAIGDCEEGSL